MNRVLQWVVCFGVAVVILWLTTSHVSAREVWVRPYTRSNGTYVKGHYRTLPGKSYTPQRTWYDGYFYSKRLPPAYVPKYKGTTRTQMENRIQTSIDKKERNARLREQAREKMRAKTEAARKAKDDDS